MDQKSTGHYRKLTSGKLKEFLERNYHYGQRGHALKQIISSAGTCSGDSGGPLYQVRSVSRSVLISSLQEVGRDYVVTGLVR